MKKIIIICCILLMILTLGAVSASENATSDSLTIDAETSLTEEGFDESLESNSDSDILSNGSSSGNFNELNTIIVNSKKNDEIKLDKDYIYNNTTDYSLINGIQISKRLTIDGQGHKIDGLNLSRIFYVTANSVSLKNISFVNSISSSDILNGDGGAIYWQGDRGTVSDCSFENCTASRGGAICGIYNLIINNSTFVNCYSTAPENDAGGALNLHESTVFNCIFVNCLANSHGGVVRLYDDFNITKCRFINCSSHWASALLLLNKGIVSDCMFENCFSNNSAILWSGEYEASIVNCTFINCLSNEYCGAIDMSGSDKKILDCNFINCSAINAGGAIYWHANGTISNCNFTNCSSAEGGGAIWGTSGSVYNCIFKNCYTTGGTSSAIWGISGSVYNCSFISCTGGGGAIWTDYCNVSYSSFENCEVGITGDNNHIFKCNFTNCHSNSAGAVDVGPNSSVLKCNFLNCFANDRGGAVMIGGSNVNVNDCSFVNCSAHTGGSIAFQNGNNGKLIEISNCNFENSLAQEGAAISIDSCFDFIISKCNFSNCNSTNIAGAVYINSINGTLSDCSFIKCTAEDKGGAIFISEKNALVNGCSFDKCEADYGGAIYIENDNSKITDCEFKNNKVYEAGGAIYAKNEGLIDNCSFNNNLADDSYGGAVYLESRFNIKSSTFKGNRALKGNSIWTDVNDQKITTNKFMLASNENRDDIIYGLPLKSIRNENYVYNGDRLVIIPNMNITCKDIVIGEDENFKVALPSDATGKITLTLKMDENTIKNQTYNLNQGSASEVFSNLGLGIYTVIIDYSGDAYYYDDLKNVTFTVRPVVNIAQNVVIGGNVEITIDLVQATGKIAIYLDGGIEEFLDIVDNKVTYTLPTNDIAARNHTLTFKYDGNDFDENVFNCWDNETGSYLPFEYDLYIQPMNVTVKENVASKNVGVVGIQVQSDAKGTLEVFINDQFYGVVDIVNGISSLDLSSYKNGKYVITWQYSGDDKYDNFSYSMNLTINNKITGGNLVMLYSSNAKYSVKFYIGGKLAKNVKVTFVIGGKTYRSANTNKNGVASIVIKKNPGSYKITSKALGVSITKKLTVSHIVTLKKVAVKKSAKNLVLTATLKKLNKKYLKGKKITFKFNGKKYTGKTNKKGVAKVTIKKSVLNKLKVGKKVTYQATYIKDTVKLSVKIKK